MNAVTEVSAELSLMAERTAGRIEYSQNTDNPAEKRLYAFARARQGLETLSQAGIDLVEAVGTTLDDLEAGREALILDVAKEKIITLQGANQRTYETVQGVIAQAAKFLEKVEKGWGDIDVSDEQLLNLRVDGLTDIINEVAESELSFSTMHNIRHFVEEGQRRIQRQARSDDNNMTEEALEAVSARLTNAATEAQTRVQTRALEEYKKAVSQFARSDMDSEGAMKAVSRCSEIYRSFDLEPAETYAVIEELADKIIPELPEGIEPITLPELPEKPERISLMPGRDPQRAVVMNFISDLEEAYRFLPYLDKLEEVLSGSETGIAMTDKIEELEMEFEKEYFSERYSSPFSDLLKSKCGAHFVTAAKEQAAKVADASAHFSTGTLGYYLDRAEVTLEDVVDDPELLEAIQKEM